MQSSIEPLFPLTLGIILLLLIAGALFAAAIPVAILLTGTLFFAGGLFFGGSPAHSPWGAGIALLVPFLVTSVFLVVTFGSPYLIFPVLSAGGVAAGVAVRRRARGLAVKFILGALWIGLVVLVVLLVVPGMFDRLKLN